MSAMFSGDLEKKDILLQKLGLTINIPIECDNQANGNAESAV